MNTWLLGTLLTISLIINVVGGFGLFNTLRKLEITEDWFRDTKVKIERVIGTMRAIDLRGTFSGKLLENGAFESDDEVGTVFQDLRDIVYSLDTVINGTDE